ncbi:MAG TPA: hypothetical protein VNR00_03240 [Opitutus sp.]|nr:hypothetical protein [Opitutus sp.]
MTRRGRACEVILPVPLIYPDLAPEHLPGHANRIFNFTSGV